MSRDHASLFRRTITNAALSLATVGVLLLVAEGLFRIAPALLPSGTFGATRHDQQLGLRVHAATVVYKRAERYVMRSPNGDGFLDIRHERTKPSGTSRVGIFGDSYVEAVQVPIEEVFYRRIPTRAARRDIEVLGFGMSGWGTLHSLMAYQRYGALYELDHVIYSFVKNDPGDHSAALRRPDGMPVAVTSSSAPGYEVRTSGGSPDTRTYRLAKWIQQRSRLLQVIVSRTSLLRASARARRDETDPGKPASRIPDANDPPSSWPPQLLAEARLLTTHLLAEFHRRVTAEGRTFAILYVPRYADELDGALPAEDRWLPWLTSVCDSLGIDVIDPSPGLRTRGKTEPTYDDHWTAAGHGVIAETLTRYLETQIGGAPGQSDGPRSSD